MTDWSPSNESPVKCILRLAYLITGCSNDEEIKRCEDNPFKFLKDKGLSNYAKWIIKNEL